jgi:uncharacterized membrane protein
MPGNKPQDTDVLAPIIDRNIRTLIQRRAAEQRSARLRDRVASAIARFAGSFTFVGVHAVVLLLWLASRLGWISLTEWYPSFTTLAGVASVEALFLTAFILISQNRLAALSEKRADLDLQMSLLAEHEVTQVIKLVKVIAERLDIAEAHDPELTTLAREVAPDQVMDKMQAHEEAELKDASI